MQIKAMYIFEGINEFNKFSHFTEINEWRIEKQLLKERVEKYKSKDYFIMLEKQFIKNKLTIWELKQEEIITWIDTMSLLRRILLKLFQKGANVSQMNIIMEYPLVYGNHMRSDYLIVYERLIVVLEFGMFNQDEKRSEERYTKKLQESINYRQIIGNLVEKEVYVVNYVMIYKPEHDRILNKKLQENIEYNDSEIGLLTSFLLKNIKKHENLSGMKQLELLEIEK